MTHIIVLGGTGFVGTGILKQLSKNPNYTLTSISKTGGDPQKHLAGVHYEAANLTQKGTWQAEIAKADWVIDCVGILRPSRKKHTSYEQNSLLPALQAIDAIKDSQTDFLFINANTAPIPEYMAFKHAVADYADQQLGSRAYNVYPGLVYGPERKSTYWLGKTLAWLIHSAHLTFLKGYRPITQQALAISVEKVVTHTPTPLTHRI
ncbi:NAD-dependent epimerase/dehydratase family protein [Weissella viridescens]|uniref:NAD-dependent epimerase/dehydratase family protein n=1 Tax=Weissella viridescens TaxID=1629 RepID=A0A3P2RFG4_WEIVI|nr:NAD-dependent epimerase/dehydratase family protein [Weissella viridescens]RRG18386.1 NAD-dependent epimerase/dehydratase family protein [Weissella viridescens]